MLGNVTESHQSRKWYNNCFANSTSIAMCVRRFTAHASKPNTTQLFTITQLGFVGGANAPHAAQIQKPCRGIVIDDLNKISRSFWATSVLAYIWLIVQPLHVRSTREQLRKINMRAEHFENSSRQAGGHCFELNTLTHRNPSCNTGVEKWCFEFHWLLNWYFKI